MKSKLHTILFLLGLCCASVVSLTVTAQDFLEPDNRFMGKESNDEYANGLMKKNYIQRGRPQNRYFTQ